MNLRVCALARNSLSIVRWMVACAPILLGSSSCRNEPVAPERRIPPLVDVGVAITTDSAQDLVLTGNLEAERSWTLSFATVGTVEEVFVREGQSVRPGQVLARLSARSYRDALAIANSKVRQAEDAFSRLEPMYLNRTLPEIKMIDVELGREQARLAASMAAKALDDTTLKAPAAGVISKRHAEPGMNLAPGVPAFSLVQIRTMVATVPLPEMHISRVNKGDRAEVSVDAVGRSVGGEVTEIAVAADLLTRTYPVKIAIPNTDGFFRVGMVASVRLPHQEVTPSVVVANKAVHVDGSGNAYVFVLGPNWHLQRREVSVLGYLENGTSLRAGLSEGERVVVSDTPMLGEGMSVRIREQGANDGGTRGAR